jgi:hypothetical protein
MAKQKIQAGATIDAVTHKELQDALGAHLRSWVAETAVGGRFTRFSAAATIASSAVSIGGAGADRHLGPAPGFVWDVRRLRLTAGSGNITAADIFGVFINDAGPASTVARTDDVVVSQRSWNWSGNVVLYPGDNLLVTNIGTIATTGSIIVSGQVLELPIGLAWKLSGS